MCTIDGYLSKVRPKIPFYLWLALENWVSLSVCYVICSQWGDDDDGPAVLLRCRGGQMRCRTAQTLHIGLPGRSELTRNPDKQALMSKSPACHSYTLTRRAETRGLDVTWQLCMLWVVNHSCEINTTATFTQRLADLELSITQVSAYQPSVTLSNPRHSLTTS